MNRGFGDWSLRMHEKGEYSAKQQKPDRSGEGQMPIAGEINKPTENDRRSEAGNSRTGIHDAGSGTGKFRCDIHRY